MTEENKKAIEGQPWKVEMSESGNPEIRLFTGDGSVNIQLTGDINQCPQCDTLMVDPTSGDWREHFEEECDPLGVLYCFVD